MLETHVLMLSVSAKISIIADFGQFFKNISTSQFQLKQSYNLHHGIIC